MVACSGQGAPPRLREIHICLARDLTPRACSADVFARVLPRIRRSSLRRFADEDIMDRPPLPPFTLETAAQKARMAEDAWNTRDPARVALAYTADSRWRNRAEFLQGREAIQAIS